MGVCLYCGKEFIKGRAGKKFCDEYCANSYRHTIDYVNKTKLCKKCGIIKPFSEFRNVRKDVMDSYCRLCHNEKQRLHRDKNSEYLKEYRRNLRLKNLDRYRELDKERRNKPERKISENISRGIRYHIKKGGKHVFDILPYTIEELINRLKETLPSGYTWEDYMRNDGSFHIDHIIPQSLYKYENVEDEEFQKCWNLQNLRLLSKKDNMVKKDFFDKDLIIENGIQHLLPKGILI